MCASSVRASGLRGYTGAGARCHSNVGRTNDCRGTLSNADLEGRDIARGVVDDLRGASGLACRDGCNQRLGGDDSRH